MLCYAFTASSGMLGSVTLIKFEKCFSIFEVSAKMFISLSSRLFVCFLPPSYNYFGCEIQNR